jgi:hypothetical protein
VVGSPKASWFRQSLQNWASAKRLFSLRAAKDTRGYTIADLVADGELDAWLPPEYRKGSG